MKIFYISLLSSIILTACVKQIDYIVDESDKQPVVNCFFTNDTCFILHLSKTQTINDSADNNFIPNADLTIFSDNKTYSLQYIDSGKYFSNFNPNINKPYFLDVKFENFHLTSDNIIPKPSKIISVDSFFKSGYSFEDKSNFFTVNIKIIDNHNEDNFYELVIQNKNVYYSEYYNETVYIYKDSYFPTDQVPAIANETQCFSHSGLFFKDNFITTDSIIEIPINFNINSPMICNNGNCIAEGSFYFILKTVSKDYYLYYKSIFMAREIFNTAGTINSLTNLSFTNKPIKIYSNINNGQGIFAGYSIDTFIVTNPSIEINHNEPPKK